MSWRGRSDELRPPARDHRAPGSGLARRILEDVARHHEWLARRSQLSIVCGRRRLGARRALRGARAPTRPSTSQGAGVARPRWSDSGGGATNRIPPPSAARPAALAVEAPRAQTHASDASTLIVAAAARQLRGAGYDLHDSLHGAAGREPQTRYILLSQVPGSSHANAETFYREEHQGNHLHHPERSVQEASKLSSAKRRVPRRDRQRARSSGS